MSKTYTIPELLPGIKVKLVHSRAKADKFLKKRDLGYIDMPQDVGAVTCFIPDEDNGIFLVLMNRELPTDNNEACAQYALLAHEAVHCKQRYFENIGEDNPSHEVEAYVVQAISQLLIIEHSDWMLKKHDQGRKEDR